MEELTMGRRTRAVVAVGVVLAVVAGGFAALFDVEGHGSSSSSSALPLQGSSASPTTTIVAGDNNRAPRSARGANGTTLSAPSLDVIVTGTISLSLARGHLLGAFDAVEKEAASVGGFVADSTSGSFDRQRPTASLVIRVPSVSFPAVFSDVARLGRVVNQNVHGQDVTGVVVNLGARIANLDAEEQALRRLVEHAGSIPNILLAENELFTVEGEIEQLTAQRASLLNQATFATLTVELTAAAPPPPKVRSHRENVVLRSVKLAWHNLAVAAHGLVLAVGWGFPALVAAALGLLVWRVRRRRRPTVPTPAGS
jgi:Domain of unknown function (DUF4349)